MDLNAICEVLQATQLADGDRRKEAEKKLDTAAEESPELLVQALLGVLSAANAGFPTPELRQEAAVILRQLVTGSASRASVSDRLSEQTRLALRAGALTALENEPSAPARRSAGAVVATLGQAAGEDCDAVSKSWPELLPALHRLSSSGRADVRVAALDVLMELAPTIGAGLLAKGGSVLQLIEATFLDGAAEIRSAGARLVLRFVEELSPDESAPLAASVQALASLLQALATEVQEELLLEVLQALVSAAEAEPDFFKESGALKSLWDTLMKICSAGAETFGDEEIQHSAMEATVTLLLGLVDKFLEDAQGPAMLEELLRVNLTWMLDVEDDVAAWTKAGQEDDEDELDGDKVDIGERNFDRIAEEILEDEDLADKFMSAFFKTIRALLQEPGATWKHTRAAVIAISQIVEHVEDDAWVDNCIEFTVRHHSHEHPRVRAAVWEAVGQICYDHCDEEAPILSKHLEKLLPALLAGMHDQNLRVAKEAVISLEFIAEELDCDDLEDCAEGLLRTLFGHLAGADGWPSLQEACLSGIATVAEIMDEDFKPFYADAMPRLKQCVAAPSEKRLALSAKALECVATVGSAVGKDTFQQDAVEVLAVMAKIVEAGMKSDDPRQESIREALGTIAETLGKDFKPCVSTFLPLIFTTLAQRPKEVSAEEMPDDDEEEPDMSFQASGDKILGLRTSAIKEMEDSLDLLNTFVTALEEDFAEFLPTTCQNLSPLLAFHFAGDIESKAFATWARLVTCAQTSVKSGKTPATTLSELVNEVLKQGLLAMSRAMPEDGEEVDLLALTTLMSRSTGISDTLRRAGAGVLTKETVKAVSDALLQVLARLRSDKVSSDAGSRKKDASMLDDADADDSKDDDTEEEVTPESVRLALADALIELLQQSTAEFVEVALPSLMPVVREYVQRAAYPDDRSLAFYVAGGVVESLGAQSVPYWNLFMNEALQGVVDKSAAVRRRATRAIGAAASVPAFAPMAAAAASHVYQVLEKQGERHRRRRAVKADAKQTALAVDAAIYALGQICEHQQAQLGTHAARAWAMWLGNLPLKYDSKVARKTHAQFLQLVASGHPVLTAAENQAKVIAVFADIYKTKLSTKALDADIAAAVARIGEAPLKELSGALAEPKRKKVEQMLRAAARAAGGA
eukprot:TRINITY_DN28694_c0_g2_i2.p1 TRINITY_DN28694_c0_g2~~TRINITY_DN28694_c0_g2_i2.p1  ORF type:complete len:1146 (+),score=367.54 TRINITY_DN28694_c0_g2_i2:83-3520(+)